MSDKLQEIFSQAKTCSDCASEAAWASISWGVVLCNPCAQVHQSMSAPFSNLFEISSDQWTEADAESFVSNFARSPNQTLEYHLLPYEKPASFDSEVVRKYFIHAKYEQRLWAGSHDIEQRKSIADIDWSQLELKGFLTKQGFSYKSWKKRWFVIADNFLLYFKSPHDSFPVGSLRIEKDSEVLVCDAPELKKKNGFTFKTPNRLFYFLADTPEEMLRWIFTIRCVVYLVANCVVDFPTEPPRTAKEPLVLGRGAEKTGWLKKQGGAVRTWKRRFFVLKDGCLVYYKSEKHLGRDPLGSISLMNQVQISLDHEQKRSHCFTIVTLGRAYFICAENEKDKEEWIAALSTVSSRREEVSHKGLPRLTLLTMQSPVVVSGRTSPRPLSESSESEGEEEPMHFTLSPLAGSNCREAMTPDDSTAQSPTKEHPQSEVSMTLDDPQTVVDESIHAEAHEQTTKAEEDQITDDIAQPLAVLSLHGTHVSDTPSCRQSWETVSSGDGSVSDSSGASDRASMPQSRKSGDRFSVRFSANLEDAVPPPFDESDASGSSGSLRGSVGLDPGPEFFESVDGGETAEASSAPTAETRWRNVSKLIGRFEESGRTQGGGKISALPRFSPVAPRGRGRGVIYFETPFVKMHRLLHDEFMPVFSQSAPECMPSTLPHL